jgi:hypothetical protein
MFAEPFIYGRFSFLRESEIRRMPENTTRLASALTSNRLCSPNCLEEVFPETGLPALRLPGNSPLPSS